MSESDLDATLLGRIAVKHRFITMDQLAEATRVRGRDGKRLGAVLVELGMIDELQLGKLLVLQKRTVEQLRAQQQQQLAAARPVARESAVTPPAPVSHNSFEDVPSAPPSSKRELPPEPDDDTPELEPRPKGPAAPLSRAVSDVHRFLQAAAEASGSDVHIHANMPIKMRRFGRLRPMSKQPLSAKDTRRILRELLTPWQRGYLDEHGEIDFAYPVDGVGRFRANVYRHHRGYNGVFHFVPATPPTLTQLGLPTDLARLTNYAQGLILVTGPAGCGKTSTLAALVDIINSERNDHILTIEDPIEYLHKSKRCVVNQRQVGRHTTSFARALRGALREDPDIICIGELRDLETISLALSAAETGHLVLATLHTGSSIGTINRIVGAYPPSQQSQVRAMMSESLRAIISQRLVPRADGAGVVPALEVLYVNTAVGSYIRENRTFQISSVLQTGKSQGMQKLDDALAELVSRRLITADAARTYGSEGGQ
jgi:twitching motility protein PilT